MTRTEGVRQSDRVQVRVPVEVSWENASGETVAQSVETLLISRSGAVFKLAEKLEGGHLLSLRRSLAQHESKTVRAVVVAEIDRDSDGFLYAVALREPRSDFWDIDFPSPAKAAEALARLLMQCSFCERREVVYLNELELRSFEARRCVARMCKHCEAPSVWVEAGLAGAGAAAGATDSPQQDRGHGSRIKPRVKARVLACIRRRGFQEEIAVCEDLSRGGVAFRSRNQYPAGTRLEIAVPYTPGSGAIFVPIRVVSSRPLPSAGLHRHGAAYLNPEQA